MNPSSASPQNNPSRLSTREVTPREVLDPEHDAPAAAVQPHLKVYLQQFWEGRWLIGCSLLITLGLTAWVTLRTTPIYEAAARIRVRPETAEFISFDENVVTGTKDEIYLETQRQVLIGRELATRVIGRLPQIVEAPASSAMRFIGTWLGKLSRRLAPQPAPASQPVAKEDPAARQRLQAAEQFLRNLTVSTLHGTQILEVRFLHRDPRLGAQIVNALCDEYIELNFQDRVQSYAYAHDWLVRRLDEYKARLETSEEQLYQTAGKDLLPLSDDSTRMMDDLDKLRLQLMEAEKIFSDRAYIWNVLETSADADAVLAGHNPNLQTLEAKRDEVEVQLSAARTKLGPRMEDVQALEAQRARIVAQVEQMRGQTRAQIRTDWEAARASRDFLQRAYDSRRQELMRIQQDMIQYNILKREVDVNRELYNDLLQRSKQVGVSAEIKPSNITILERAIAPLRPKLPNKRRNLLLGATLGLLLGVGLKLFLDYMDASIRNAEEVEQLFGLPVFGLVPRIRARHTRNANPVIPRMWHDQPHSLFTEQIRTVRTALQYSTAGHAPRAILITSALAGEGKTSVAINLACTFAQRGQNVLLIDADLKRPTVHTHFNLDRRRGLAEYLTGSLTLQAVTLETDLPCLRVMTSGEHVPNPVELMDSDQMRGLIEHARQAYDHVIIDTAPTMHMADVSVLSPFVDGVLLVAQPGQTSRAAMRSCIAQISSVRGRILGVVLNNVDQHRRHSYGYGYGYGYGEEQQATDKLEPAGAAPTDK